MADRFIIVPGHVVTGASEEHTDAHVASVAAASLVEKNRTPFFVVQLISKSEPSALPRVDTVQIAQLARIQAVSNG